MERASIEVERVIHTDGQVCVDLTDNVSVWNVGISPIYMVKNTGKLEN